MVRYLLRKHKFCWVYEKKKITIYLSILHKTSSCALVMEIRISFFISPPPHVFTYAVPYVCNRCV